MEESESKLISELQKYKGGKAMVWDYSLGHLKLLIKLEKKGISSPVFIIVVACSFYSGAFSWTNINLRLESNLSTEKDARLWVQKIIDDDNNVEIISTGGIMLVDNQTNENFCFR